MTWLLARSRAFVAVPLFATATLALANCTSSGEASQSAFGLSRTAERAPFGLDSRPPNPTCVAPKSPPPGTGVAEFQRVYSTVTLATPMMMAKAPGDRDHVYVAQREGTLVRFSASNPPTGAPPVVLTVPNPIDLGGAESGNEGGLLGFAFHPKFAENGQVYFS